MISDNAHHASRLIVFAKAPVPGRVKTRLQPQFSQRQSAMIHQTLVEHCIATVSEIERVSLELWTSGEHVFWSQLQQCYSLSRYQQQGADLGLRMYNACQDALDRGKRVVIIGTDCPYLSAGYICEAFSKLVSGADVVLGPAEDGGYVLMGLQQAHLPLFSDISWGSSQVYEQTCQRLRSLRLCWQQLPSLQDIDRPEDFTALQECLPDLARRCLSME